MRERGTRLLLLAAAVVLLTAVGTSSASGGRQPPAPWLEVCGEWWCGTFEVPENRADPGGRRIDLNVIVVPATSASQRHPDEAIAYLAGGPGGAAASDGTARWLPSVLAGAVVQHDVLLVDQRGTGESSPLLCPLPPTLPSAPTADQLRAWWVGCLRGFDGDLRFYGTNDAVDDLDAVREALGYDGLHLYGGSYGVVAAQAYLARHGEHVRTAVLDSGVALGTRPFERWARSYQDALDRTVARCARAARCRAAFPDPAADLATVLTRLERNPVRVGRTTVEPIVYAGLVQVLSEGGSRGDRVLPLFLRTAAAQGVPRAVDRLGPALLDALVGELQRPAKAMLYAIRCAEPWAQADPAATARQSAGTYLETFMARASVEIEAICDVTPPLADVTGLHAPARSTVPALIAMGAEDPKLPATTIVGMKAAMPNARVAVVRTAGHGTIGTRCIQRLATQLFVSGSSAALDTACARRQSFPPFVLRWSDWERLGG